MSSKIAGTGLKAQLDVWPDQSMGRAETFAFRAASQETIRTDSGSLTVNRVRGNTMSTSIPGGLSSMFCSLGDPNSESIEVEISQNLSFLTMMMMVKTTECQVSGTAKEPNQIWRWLIYESSSIPLRRRIRPDSRTSSSGIRSTCGQPTICPSRSISTKIGRESDSAHISSTSLRESTLESSL